MNAPVKIEFVPAVRNSVSLLIALAGASGTGKTLSGLKIARGLAGGDDSKIAMIDTEAGRGLHYAPAPDQQPGPELFAFKYFSLRPPFTPEAYADAIKVADDAGFAVIVVDSCSHEYEGDGGLHDIHDALADAAVEIARKNHNQSWGPFDEGKAFDRASVGAWREPKARHKRFVQRLLQCRAHLVLCLRAEDKIRIERVKDEKSGRERTVIVQPKDMPASERWTPICEKRFMYEMTLSFVLTPERPGVPLPIKLQEQHRGAVPLDKPLSEETGRALAEWTAGGKAPDAGSTLVAEAKRAAGEGSEAFRKWWNQKSTKQQWPALKLHVKEFQAIAEAADRQAKQDEDPFGLPPIGAKAAGDPDDITRATDRLIAGLADMPTEADIEEYEGRHIANDLAALPQAERGRYTAAKLERLRELERSAK